MICPRCGYDSEGNFCNKCGSPLTPNYQNSVQTPQAKYRPIPQYRNPSVPAPISKKQRISENKANGVACCPKCGSASLSANKRGWSIVTGMIGKNKIIVTCLNCGHHWKP